MSCWQCSVMCLSADSNDTQFTWIESFAACDVEILDSVEDEDEKIRNAVSIFEFEAVDIDGRTVPLSTYR